MRLLSISIGCMLAIFLGSASGCEEKNSEAATEITQEKPQTETTQPMTDAQPVQPTPAVTPMGNGPKVKIKTKFGDMTVVLFDETPKHRDNFIKLAREGFYDGLLFHRCIKGFMVQGGDPKSKGAPAEAMLGAGGPGYTVDAEFNNKFVHIKGALAAARQGDAVNPAKKSSGSQFYIVQGNPTPQPMGQIPYTDEQKKLYAERGGASFLDGAYTVFGQVIEGLEIIDLIAAQPTRPGDRPVEDIVMDVDVVE
jgi:cyclophilin family peptidyl-prolyl cis-trans isomerase